MKIKGQQWMNEEGELNLVSKTQKELAKNSESIKVLLQFHLFKQNGLTQNAQQIRKNVNLAMDIAYERDAGIAQNERWDTPSNFGI
ncbi:hypothetical protein OQJ18_01980 [Fluoribacter dumoffii]|uniref:Uncharacterized protein n=1 Tax=Fluoribacter dumoffii TaxID=463 RepID=A0A377GAP1_9GAMM|nr:hypothetical protein [Fluoribacter dumoffii]KTC88615.1 hypothetical protein Ldum_2873 [Fluoribacter dumoffii NY 23]MCW8386092.1 hypothetical protein [Fluoribacter dumoffii]MCW8419144.1 hypothetical protein [Fluoribacter dumoffii]MCW8453012.1 hypothetical protein [Fluoribacter dumoffii]MCW8459770.1 hypothetical protein [Fluoribacter dumoffii]